MPHARKAVILATALLVAAWSERAGAEDQQKLSAEEIAPLIDNPVGELIQLPVQYDRLRLEDPLTGETLDVHTTKVIPTFPVGRGPWRLVNRVVVTHASVPNPFTGRSMSGFGDLTYVGALTPRESGEFGRGKVIWAVGPTVIFPTASEELLGQGKYQAGPAAAAAYLGPKATLGLFAQHWWSFAGDESRADARQSNLQYFWSVRLPQQWSVGAAPSITVDWNASDGPAVTVPLGIGLNKTLFLGRLPARLGAEVTYYAITPDTRPEPGWGMRFSMTPVVPAFLLWGK